MQKKRALALFSGGLDSILAVKVIQQQGIDVLAINFTSPFFGCSPILDGEPVAAKYARRYDIPFRSIPLGAEFIEMLRHPRHGYGSALNPCIDCKTFMLRCAGALLQELQAEGKTLIALLRDMHQVSRHFPTTLLLAREVIAWGPTDSVVTQANLNRAHGLPTAPDPGARECHRPTPEHE